VGLCLVGVDIELISTYVISVDAKFPFSPATVSAECFCLSLKRAARAIGRRYDEALEPVDLRNGQYSTLMAIAGKQPVSMQVLAEMLGMDRTTLTATLKPLQRRRLVSIQPDLVDRRSRILQLTGKGAALLKDAVPLWRKAQQSVGRMVEGSGSLELRQQLSRFS
jgi:DNA-binding MarR family transcriptional regulator